jgi:putative nucleotidyltransferase with HDIG domain
MEDERQGPDCLRTEPDAADCLRMHCRRVACWALEIARSIDLTPVERNALEQAALLHHTPYILLSEPAEERLFGELGITAVGASSMDPGAQTILARFNNVRGAGRNPDEVRLASVLEMAETFDEYFEFEPFRDPQDDADPEIELITECLQVRSRADVIGTEDLPVWPKAAQMAVMALSDPDTGARDLALIAKTDPVLASGLIRVANSALFGGQRAIGDLTRAVTQIGLSSARKVLLGLAVRPLFASSALYRLWRHSLDAANAAHHLANLSGRCDPEHAFLAGLVHDIGKLLIQRMPIDALDRYQSLIGKGCPEIMVERLVFRQDHAALGAELLRHWKFPGEFSEAILYHHRPERCDSPLAATLYLTEVTLAANEDLASLARLNMASTRAGLSMDTVTETIALDRSVEALALAS